MRKLGHARRRPYRRAHQALADALDEPARAMLARAAVRLPHQANGALEEAVAKACRALEQHPAAALRLRTGRRRHLHRVERAVRRAVERAGHLLGRPYSSQDSKGLGVLGEGGAALRHRAPEATWAHDHGLGWQVEEIFDSGAKRAQRRVARRRVEHLHLEHDAVHLPQHCVQVVVADGGPELVRGAKEVLAHEGVEANGRGVDVRDQLEDARVGAWSAGGGGAEREVELHRVQLQLLEVPDALRRAVSQQLRLGRLDGRTLAELLLLRLRQCVAQEDGELQHFGRDHEV
mmetsp:Transcript_67707/g.185642  ORF Transcript_67707/g.185642 Transcript_67707/m.185642 type:complete len:290 (+) Transcript_67707:1048-1917(+)